MNIDYNINVTYIMKVEINNGKTGVDHGDYQASTEGGPGVETI
jgi:hypothetical protein